LAELIESAAHRAADRAIETRIDGALLDDESRIRTL